MSKKIIPAVKESTLWVCDFCKSESTTQLHSSVTYQSRALDGAIWTPPDIFHCCTRCEMKLYGFLKENGVVK